MSETQPKQAEAIKTKVNKLSDQQIIDNILTNMPSSDQVPVELPSKNKFYSLQDPSKPVSLRPMTFEDERSMMSNKNINVDVLNNLLSRCLSNISVEQLLQMDKLFLIMKLREISYGDQYTAQISCAGCRRDNNIEFN